MSKKIIVTLLIIIGVCLMIGLFYGREHFQSKFESNLPQKDEAEAGDMIRVLLKTDGFAQVTHPEVRLMAEKGLRIIHGDNVTEAKAGEEIIFTPADERFYFGTIRVEKVDVQDKISVCSLQRGYGIPTYRGTLELFKTSEGIVIVNELSIEEYLCAVVPSEMPASYELEALKAQAVCARSYAYNQSRDYAYPEYKAHVDDSTSFQVYGNSVEQESSNCAVQETCGQKVWYKDAVATTYYYSTSCGISASITAWGSELDETNRYLQSISVCNEEGEAYEADLPWYRWEANIPKQVLSDLIELNTQVEIGTLLNVTVTKKGDGGIAQEITAVGTTNKVVVVTENKIRSALGGGGYTIKKQDGTVVNSSKLLPSAFFTIKKEGDSYCIQGGGYGHGIGMSQNGANEMAKQGKDYIQILNIFYSGVTIR